MGGIKMDIKRAVLLNGPANSGKTLATKFLLNNFHKVQKVACKDKLHELTMSLFNVPSDIYWSIYNDQIAKEKPSPYFRVHLGDELYDLEEILKYNLELEKGVRELYFEYGQPTKSTLSCREAMIYVSEVIVKPRFGSDFFGKARATTIASSNNLLFIDDSAGFEGECQPIIDLLGQENILLIRTHRDGFSFEGDSRSYLGDHVFHNTMDLWNDGDIEHWNDKVKSRVMGWLNREVKLYVK